jgi:hypothetical protein
MLVIIGGERVIGGCKIEDGALSAHAPS